MAHAGNFGMGMHGGYGVIKYEEHSDALGTDRRSDASLGAFIFGVSGEYSPVKPANFFIGLVTDFTLSLTDDEEHTENSAEFQTNDLKIFGQFYDLRFGYKNNIDNFYYRLYASGGWDGIHFARNRFMERGIPANGKVTEDFSLWRIGGGAGAGYKFGHWALDGRAAYAYYPAGQVRNSKFEGIQFDTNGTCLDAGVGIMREISKNINFYLGGSYTLILLDESEVKRNMNANNTITEVVFPYSKTQIMVGIANLTYAF